MSLSISVMTTADVDFSIRMTDREQWGNVKADFIRLVYFEPDGCFVARRNGRRIGMVTSTTYGSYAFMGSLIVQKGHRGAGVGEQLMRQALAYLDSKGIKTVELDGVFEAVSLYRRLGFKDKYLSLRFYRPPQLVRDDKQGEVSRVCAEELVNFDRSMTGLCREKLLGRFLEEFGEDSIVTGTDKMTGYGIVKPRSGGNSAIGPVVAENTAAFEEILERVLRTHSDRGLSIGVPEIQHGAVEPLLDRGFIYRQPSLRMYRGERADYEENVYGIASPEKG